MATSYLKSGKKNYTHWVDFFIDRCLTRQNTCQNVLHEENIFHQFIYVVPASLILKVINTLENISKW